MNELTNWIANLIKSKSKFDIGEANALSADLNYHLKKHLYFVTVHFKYFKSNIEINKQKMLMDSFRSYYIDLVKALLGKNFNKKTIREPFFIMAYDVEGSKIDKSIKLAEVPHLHGLALLHPKTISSFEKLLLAQNDKKTGFLCNRSIDGRVENVKFENFDGRNGGLEIMSEYIFKYTHVLIDNNTNLQPYFILPDIKSDKYPFYKRIEEFYNDKT